MIGSRAIICCFVAVLFGLVVFAVIPIVELAVDTSPGSASATNRLEAASSCTNAAVSPSRRARTIHVPEEKAPFVIEEIAFAGETNLVRLAETRRLVGELLCDGFPKTERDVRQALSYATIELVAAGFCSGLLAYRGPEWFDPDAHRLTVAVRRGRLAQNQRLSHRPKRSPAAKSEREKTAGRIEAKQNVHVSVGKDVVWTGGGLLRAGGNVHVESEGGSVALGDISASKASVTAAGDMTGRLGVSGELLGTGERSCATYRIDADGTVVVSFESATIDVRGGAGVTLDAGESLTIAPVSVSTVVLDPGSDKKGRSGLIETKVTDAALGGYQSPETDVEISVPKNLTVYGSIRTLSDEEAVRPDTMTAGDAVSLGRNPNPLEPGDIAITVDAAGNPTRYEGGGEDGVLVLRRTKEGTTGKLTSEGAVLLVDGSVAGGPADKVSTMLELEAVAADGNSALPVRDPHAALSASRFTPEDVNAQLPLGTNEVVRDETALARATKE